MKKIFHSSCRVVEIFNCYSGFFFAAISLFLSRLNHEYEYERKNPFAKWWYIKKKHKRTINRDRVHHSSQHIKLICLVRNPAAAVITHSSPTLNPAQFSSSLPLLILLPYLINSKQNKRAVCVAKKIPSVVCLFTLLSLFKFRVQLSKIKYLSSLRIVRRSGEPGQALYLWRMHFSKSPPFTTTTTTIMGFINHGKRSTCCYCNCPRGRGGHYHRLILIEISS